MSQLEQPGAAVVGERDLYIFETFLRQRGDFQALLQIDELLLRDDLDAEDKAARLQRTIIGAMTHGQRQT